MKASTLIAFTITVASLTAFSCLADEWKPLFDGKSLDGWQASENVDTWSVEDGCLVADGPRSHLFYQGPVGDHDFRNFELRAEIRTNAYANSGIYFHTKFQQAGWPDLGYETQVCNRHRGGPGYGELKRTASLYAVQNSYKTNARDEEWFCMRIRVVGNRICVWLNDQPTVDYLQPDEPVRHESQPQRVLSHGTFALQAHDPGSRVAYRKLEVRLLPDDLDPSDAPRASDKGYGLSENLMDRMAAENVPVIDYHVHLRGGMTVDKAVDRQAVTGVNVGVLKNIGKGWAIETDDQLREFLDSVEGKPVFVGLQVNDRDWMTKHSAELLGRLDYVLADTMIMPMPNDDSQPVKLWLTDGYTIDDPQAWMERYMRHCLRVLAEPCTILANPTYLPPPVEDMYDELWTNQRMRQFIQAAIKNNVALEINARSGLPHDRFLRMAREMGAKFTFGSNNFDDLPIDMSRCFEAVDLYELGQDQMYIPAP